METPVHIPTTPLPRETTTGVRILFILSWEPVVTEHFRHLQPVSRKDRRDENSAPPPVRPAALCRRPCWAVISPRCTWKSRAVPPPRLANETGGFGVGLGRQHRENKTLQVILAVDRSLIQRNRFRRKCPRGQSVGPAALCDRPQEREVTLGSRRRHVGDPAAQVSHCPERLSRGQPWAESHFLIRKGPLRAGRDVDP